MPEPVELNLEEREALARAAWTPGPLPALYAVAEQIATDRLAAERAAHEALREAVEALVDEHEAHAWTPECADDDGARCRECTAARALRDVLAAAAPTPRQDGRQFDCMFHDEGIPDAPCNCSDGKVRYGSHEIVTPTHDGVS